MPLDSPTPGTNVIVMAPSLSDEKRRTCLDLQAAGSLDRLDVLYVTYSGTPADLTDRWRDHHGDLPARMGIVVVGDQPGQAPGGDSVPENVFVTTANPNDITGLGMRLNNYLNDRDGDSQLVVCFDSMTEMLQFAELQPVFKFLHMFAGQLRDADAAAHFHLDPGAHDDRTINRLKPLFDDAVDLR
ncbi:DUF7504 family protein [Haloarcula onubensis]|uniref:Uncharacterized protein n=1 Tax=Haloarcula onubensis TaxID=2950539 RepID=A0ABU2FT23_9EURY|nr:hypothetical protein [Halomicroarcula sp. S3CR25-11]MDS0283402.1 hypothetical protein [Halomicroarcula sp. S3CR25-11]